MSAQARPRTKYLPIYLPGDVYARLERAALAAERDPLQHARWLIKRAVQGDAPQADPPRPSVEAGATH